MIPFDTSNSLSDSAHFHRLSDFRVESLLIQNTGTFNQQFLRPYVTNSHLNNNELTTIATSIMDKVHQGNIDGLTIAGVGNSFLTRSSEPDANVLIPNGWDVPRAQFIMKIVMTNSLGLSNPCFVTGYTDHAGINPATGTIDPRMIFIVNSITQARTVQMRSPVGVSQMISPIGTQQIMVDFSNSNMQPTFNHQYQYMMKPDDIFRTINNSPMYRNADDPTDHNFVNDTTIRLDARGKSGSKRINNPNNYIADVVNSWVNSPADEGSTPIQNALKYYRNVNTFEKTDIWKNEFFQVINSRRTGYSTFGNSFTFKELSDIDPSVMNVITFVDTHSHELHHTGQTMHWGGTDLNTVAASMLASSVPALMTEQMIAQIVFKSTNNTINGQPQTDIIAGGGFDSSVDMRQNYENFKRLFEIMVLNDITFNNQMAYFLEMRVDISGESWIKIKIDNEPLVDYVTPTFCDSLFSPVITTRKTNLFQVTNDIESLIGYVDMAKEESKSHYGSAAI